METGSLADWVSGTGSLLAVIVALAGYWISRAQRKNDQKDVEEHRAIEEVRIRQGVIHQIGFKLSALTDEAMTTYAELIPPGQTEASIATTTDPRQLVGEFNPNVGMEVTTARHFAVDEQNLLMLVKENDFLMDYTVALARHESIHSAMLEYRSKREAIMSMLPIPKTVSDRTASHFLSDEQWLAMAPSVIALSSLLTSMRAMSKQNIELLAQLCEEFQPKMTKHFPLLNIHAIEIGS